MNGTNFEAWRRTYDGFETHVDGWSRASFTEGHGDQVYRRSTVACNTNERYVIKTETLVEQVWVPVVTIHGSSYPATGGHLNQYEVNDNGWSSMVKTRPMKVYGTADNGGNMSCPPHKTGPTNTVNEKQTPNYNGFGRRTDNWKDGSPAKEGHLKLYEVEDNGWRSPVKTGSMEVYGAADNGGNMSSPPHKTGPMSTENGKQTPNSNGFGRRTDNWKDGSPAKGGHLKLYEVDDNGWRTPVKTGPIEVYGAGDNGGNISSPPHKTGPISTANGKQTSDESLRGPMKVYGAADNGGNMSVSSPQKTGSVSITNWKQIPNSNGHGESTNNSKDGTGTGTNIYGGNNGTASNGVHPQFEGYHGRNEMVTDTKQKTTKITEADFTKTNNNKGAGVDTWKETRRSPTVMTAPIRPVAETPTQGRFTVPPSVEPKEIFPSTIDSREAERRYGGYSVPPQAMKETKTYKPTIDKNEAARWYNERTL